MGAPSVKSSVNLSKATPASLIQDPSQTRYRFTSLFKLLHLSGIIRLILDVIMALLPETKYVLV